MMEMHDCFPEWYRLCHADPSNKTLLSRWSLVLAIKRFICADNALDIVNVYLQKPSTVAVEITEICKKKELAFPSRKNELELSVLTGAAIISILEGEKSTRADIVSVACLTFNCSGTRGVGLIPEVLASADNYLPGRVESIRLYEKVPKINTSTWKLTDEIENIATAISEENMADASGYLGAAFKKLLLTVKELAKETNRVVRETNEQLCHRKEESEILWWLLPAYSRYLLAPVKQYTQAETALVIGQELSEKISALPGPLSAKAFIRNMLSHAQLFDENITITETIFSSPQTFRNQIKEKCAKSDPTFFPLHYCLTNSLDIPEQTAWKSLIEATTFLPLDQGFGSVELSFQFYLENILTKLLAKGN